ncbi:MAG: PAS domain S-box protein [Nitrospirae bacterium]|nr:PAS domain S-box protein [Nitrospirota bacterium]
MSKNLSSVFFKYLTLNSIKYLSRVLLIITLLLMATVLFLEWTSAAQVRELVISKFNIQQLILARGASAQIKNNVDSLKDILLTIKHWPVIQFSQDDSALQQLKRALESSKDNGLLIARLIDKDKHVTHLLDYKRSMKVYQSDRDSGYLTWAGIAAKDHSNVLFSEVYALPSGKDRTMLLVDMAVPLWRQSVDDSHLDSAFKGVLVFTVDVDTLIGNVGRTTVSGRTGYAWVIDNQGTFLYHPEAAFIGKNAFEVRKKKKSDISYEQINSLQRELLLKGKEGMRLYKSGWHKGLEKEITKLIAFTPININSADSSHTWSVAVVAPVSEVEDEVHAIQLRQFVIGGVFISILIMVFVLIIRILTSWTSTLRNEVDTKTKELRKSVRQYRSLVENAHDVIFSVDKENNFLSMNIYGYLFFKTKPKEILGKGFGDLFTGEPKELVLKAIKDVYELNISKPITVNVNIDAKEYWLSINFTPLLDEKGSMYAVLGIARDITEEFLIEQNMIRTEKLASMGTMVAGVAHEINNPMAIILGFTDMLSEKIPQDSDVYDILKIIEKQANNAKRVVENLLSFARCSEQKDERDELVDMNKIIEELFSFIGNNLKLKKITVNKTLSEELPIVKADPVELQQVFLNIINNAEFSMKGGGVLTVVTERVEEGKGVEIRVSDTGGGIKKEHRSRVFDPLFTTKKVGEGTGLGLSVSYGIITKYGGTIRFETKTEEESRDTGTTFIITLPGTQTEATIEKIVNTENLDNNVLT